MIVTDIKQIDIMAEQRFGSNSTNLVAVDMDDYARIKSDSSYLNAMNVTIPFAVQEGIAMFEQAIKEFMTEGAHHVLLHIDGVDATLEERNIKFKEVSLMLKTVDKHFNKMVAADNAEGCNSVNIVWGTSSHNTTDTDGYEVRVIVGYK